jgi:hypothetical protein
MTTTHGPERTEFDARSMARCTTSGYTVHRFGASSLHPLSNLRNMSVQHFDFRAIVPPDTEDDFPLPGRALVRHLLIDTEDARYKGRVIAVRKPSQVQLSYPKLCTGQALSQIRTTRMITFRARSP